MTRIDPEADLAGVAALGEPVRRALYLYVSRHGEVGRDEVSRALGVTRALAAFHLDRLVEEGLLQADYRRLSGRTGPGAGRPAKVYRRTARQIAVTVPPRNYEVAARVLLEGIEKMSGGRPPAPVAEAAREFGEALTAEVRRRAGARPDRRRLVEALVEVLEEHGFEPAGDDGGIRLGNCPFDVLARDHRGLVCGMNLEAMGAVADGLRRCRLEAVLDPRPDTCCVRFRVRHGSDRAPPPL